MDLAIAAGFAGDALAVAALDHVDKRPHGHASGYHHHSMEVDEYVVQGELPSVDDLEVAAAAAAAALEVLAPAGQSSSEEESSSNDDSDSSSEDEDESDDAMDTRIEQDVSKCDTQNAKSEQQSQQPVQISLTTNPEHPGVIQLSIRAATVTQSIPNQSSITDMRKVETDSSALTSSDEDIASSDDMDSEAGEPMGYDEMREMITKAYQAVDDEDYDDEGGGKGSGIHNTAGQELGLPELSPLDVELQPDDALQPAGVVLSVLEGVIVVQGLIHSPPLAEGSVLVLDDARIPVGRVEEVFGPVMQPFYVMRWAGQGPAPDALAPGAALSSVPRLMTKIAPETLAVQDKAIDYEAGLEGEEEEEVYFSDDEAEAAYRWKQQAKRKADANHPTAEHGTGGRGRGGKQRRRGDGRQQTSASLQAHATAGQLSAVLGVSDGGRGGRGRRGRGRGRGGDQQNVFHPQAQAHAPVAMQPPHHPPQAEQPVRYGSYMSAQYAAGQPGMPPQQQHVHPTLPTQQRPMYQPYQQPMYAQGPRPPMPPQGHGPPYPMQQPVQHQMHYQQRPNGYANGPNGWQGPPPQQQGAYQSTGYGIPGPRPPQAHQGSPTADRHDNNPGMHEKSHVAAQWSGNTPSAATTIKLISLQPVCTSGVKGIDQCCSLDEESSPRICRFCLEEEEYSDVEPADIENQRLFTGTCNSAQVQQTAAPNPVCSMLQYVDQWFQSSDPTKSQASKAPANPLISPCLCTGTSRYVHRYCLQRWRDSTSTAFDKCTVCGYTYQFKGGRLASMLRYPLMAPLLLVVFLAAMIALLGFLPAWRSADGNLGIHMLNGFVTLGLAGFGITLADIFSSRRAMWLLATIGAGRDISHSVTYAVISLFQLLAIAILVACLAVSSMWHWGVVVLAVLGYNYLSFGPVYKSCQEALEWLACRSARNMMVLEVDKPHQHPASLSYKKATQSATMTSQQSTLPDLNSVAYHIAAQSDCYLTRQVTPLEPACHGSNQEAHVCANTNTTSAHTEKEVVEGTSSSSTYQADMTYERRVHRTQSNVRPGMTSRISSIHGSTSSIASCSSYSCISSNNADTSCSLQGAAAARAPSASCSQPTGYCVYAEPNAVQLLRSRSASNTR